MERKVRPQARFRANYYLECPESAHPYSLLPPIAQPTKAVQTLLTEHNYIFILTQLDKNLYMMQKRYIYCDEDVWMTGEGLVFNENPKKAIYVKPMCTKARKECICFHEGSWEFLSLCPKCKTPNIFIQKTPFKCTECGMTIAWEKVDQLPYAKIPCEWCPREVGWEAAKKISDLIEKKLMVRKSQMIDKELKDIIETLDKTLPNGEEK
jgi:hypothetical protein